MVNISEKFCALIMAAGSSSRMGGVAKQFLDVGGKSVLLRSMEAFENCEFVDKIIVVTRCDYFAEVELTVKNGNITKFAAVVEGAQNRMESVRSGMAHIGDSQHVLVHDCARPLVTKEVISNVAAAAQKYGAAICGVPVKDTVKSVDSDGFVSATLDRKSLLSVQTPQGFKAKILLNALNSKQDLSSFTDDASVVESAGYKVMVTFGDYTNIKITTPEDIITAQNFFKGEKI